MHLGINCKHAIVCAARRGIGRACAATLAREGVYVVINGRDPATLAQTVAAIGADSQDVSVLEVVGDITQADTRARLCDAVGRADILVNHAGGSPPGDFRAWDRETWLRALDANMLSAIDMIKLVTDAMSERGYGRIINITSFQGHNEAPYQKPGRRPCWPT